MNEARRTLRALVETVMAFDHPDFPAIAVERVEARVLECFPLEGHDGAAAWRAALMAFAGEFGPGDSFERATLAARRAHLRLWARSEVASRRRLYTTLKSAVLWAAYSLPELRRAIGAP